MMNEQNNTKSINETPAVRLLGRSAMGALALLLGGGVNALSADSGTDNRAPDVPDAIVVDSSTNKVSFHGFGVGFQIYTWNGTSWGSAVPEATLFDDEGNIVALHFGVFAANGGFIGPAWQSNSGSEVVGKLPPAAVIVNTDAIPWLRLEALSTEGPGIFADTTFIQRVNTTGGKAPSVNGTVIGQVARVPYTADYFFYRESNN